MLTNLPSPPGKRSPYPRDSEVEEARVRWGQFFLAVLLVALTPILAPALSALHGLSGGMLGAFWALISTPIGIAFLAASSFKNWLLQIVIATAFFLVGGWLSITANSGLFS